MTPGVTLCAYDPDAHETAVRAMRIAAWQLPFSAQPADLLDGLTDGTDVHVISRDDVVMGMFCVDRRYHLTHTFAQPDTPGIRGFVVDEDRQGDGIATAAIRWFPTYLPASCNVATAFYMTVNVRNAGGYKAFTRGGFVDTGVEFTQGIHGTQNVLRLSMLPV